MIWVDTTIAYDIYIQRAQVDTMGRLKRAPPLEVTSVIGWGFRLAFNSLAPTINFKKSAYTVIVRDSNARKMSLIYAIHIQLLW